MKRSPFYYPSLKQLEDAERMLTYSQDYDGGQATEWIETALWCVREQQREAQDG